MYHKLMFFSFFFRIFSEGVDKEQEKGLFVCIEKVGFFKKYSVKKIMYSAGKEKGNIFHFSS